MLRYIFSLLEFRGQFMEKSDALNILFSCAKEYQKKLENNNLLFVFGKCEKPHFFEASFYKRNFMHLTGIKLFNNAGSLFFYERLITERLSVNDFYFSEDGTTIQKLTILPQLINIATVSKMIGFYNNSKPYLMTDRFVGNINACMGFIKENGKPGFYIPNTALNADIRDLTQNAQRVLCVFKKKIQDEKYTELCYIAKKLNLEEIKFTDDINCRLI